MCILFICNYIWFLRGPFFIMSKNKRPRPQTLKGFAIKQKEA
jgi:hypothetical protein